MAWFGFWVFMAVAIVVDGNLFSKGYDTILHTQNTGGKEIQIIKINQLKNKPNGL